MTAPIRLPWALALAVFGLILAALAPGVALEDTGELSACAMTLSLSHPPGHPWHTLLGRLFLLLPVGSADFRLNLMAACGGVLGALAAARVAGLLAGGLAGPWVAGLVYAVGSAAWRQSAAGEKYALAAATVGWALVALLEFRRGGAVRHLLLGTLLLFATFGFHLLGIYLLPVLGWAVWRTRRVRVLALVLVVAILPLGGMAMVPAIRAAARPPINWDEPARAPRLVRYLATRRYAARFSAGDVAVATKLSGGLRRAAATPWRAQGVAVLLTALGVVVLWSRDRGALGLLGAVCVAAAFVTELFAAIYPNPDVDRFYLPAALAMAAVAGVGAARCLAWRRWMPAICAGLVAWQAWAAWPAARRDRDFAGADHERNLLMNVPEGAVLIGWGDLWMFPVWHARLVMRDARAAGGLSAETLEYGVPARRELEEALGPRASGLRGWQDGSALVWRVAELAAPRPVLLTDDPQFDAVPSRGLRWRGLLIRITGPDQAPDVDDPGLRWLRGLRLRSIRHPRDPFEDTLTRYYAQSIHNTGRVALRAGRRQTARVAARAGLRLDPASLQLQDLEWRARTGGRPAGGPAAGRLLAAKGMELLQKNMLPWAAFAWEEALEYDPSRFDVLQNLGTLAAIEERFADAAGWFARAVRRLPDSAEAKTNLAEARRSQAMVATLPLLERAADAAPADPARWCELGNAYWYAGRPRVSETCYRRALAIQPGYARALGNLGSTLVGQGRIREAIAMYLEAIAARPDDPAPMLNLAEVYRGLGDQRRSAEWSSRAVALHSRH